MPAKKNKNTWNNTKNWLIGSVVLNVALLVTIAVMWIIIAGAGTNRYSQSILNKSQTFLQNHYCVGSGYAHLMSDIDSEKITEAQKVATKNTYAFALCGRGLNDPMIQQMLGGGKLY